MSLIKVGGGRAKPPTAVAVADPMNHTADAQSRWYVVLHSL